MVGEGTVHQRVLTGDLSPLLFIGEHVNPWSRHTWPNSEPQTYKSHSKGPKFLISESPGLVNPPFLMLEKGGTKRL